MNNDIGNIPSTEQTVDTNQQAQDIFNNIDQLIGDVQGGGEIDDIFDHVGLSGNTIGGVDLSEVCGDLDLNDPDIRGYISEEIGQLKQMGYSNEQAQFHVSRGLELYKSGYEEAMREMEEEEIDPREVRQILEQELNIEEKRNLKSISNWLRGAVGQDLLTHDVLTSIFSDPLAIKVFNQLYKASIGGTNRTMEQKGNTSFVNRVQLTPSNAMNEYIQWLSTQDRIDKETTAKKINALRQTMNPNDVREFDELFSVLM